MIHYKIQVGIYFPKAVL